MKLSALNIYTCPECKGKFEIIKTDSVKKHDILEGTLKCKACGGQAAIHKGIPALINQRNVKGSDLKFQKFYDRMSPVYDPIVKFASRILFGGDIAFRGEFARHLELKPQDRVLEVSVGSCGNYPYIGTFSGHLELFGLDISKNFLKQGLKNIKRWKIDAELCQGNADDMPYGDNSFDCVFHKGGINGFSDKSKALGEMFRVAKPGSLITVSDETENMFYTKKQFKKVGLPSFEELGAPLDLIPEEAVDVELEQTAQGMMYVMKFRKPLE
ncbi:MAG: methyltransferase domain-containing protein [Desulfobacteraceae bacterium]|nr:methyltransferase domain-containing protein [Desulfobacteraceae bacterium]